MTRRLCTLGLGPTPVPIELTASLATLDTVGIEVAWATSWNQAANALLAIAGLDGEFRATHFETWHHVDDWKWALVAAEAARDQIPFVWIDDQEITPSTCHWSTSESSPASRLVRTNRLHGLTPDTWAAILDWLEATTGCDLAAARAASASPRRS